MGRDTHLLAVVAGLTEPGKPRHPDPRQPRSVTQRPLHPSPRHPGGMPAISRGLSEPRATPPEIPQNAPRPSRARNLISVLFAPLPAFSLHPPPPLPSHSREALSLTPHSPPTYAESDSPESRPGNRNRGNHWAIEHSATYENPTRKSDKNTTFIHC